MALKYLFIPLLALFAITAAQISDELNIPFENDNQFPSDNILESNESVLDGNDVGIGLNESIDKNTGPKVDDEPQGTPEEKEELLETTDAVDEENGEVTEYNKIFDLTEEPVEVSQVQEEPTEEAAVKEELLETTKVVGEENLEVSEDDEESFDIPDVQEEMTETPEVEEEPLETTDVMDEVTENNEELFEVTEEPIETTDVNEEPLDADNTEALETSVYNEETLESIGDINKSFDTNKDNDQEKPVEANKVYEEQLGTADQVDNAEETPDTDLIAKTEVAEVVLEATNVKEEPMQQTDVVEDILESEDINEISESTGNNNYLIEANNTTETLMETNDAMEEPQEITNAGGVYGISVAKSESTNIVEEQPLHSTESEGLLETTEEISENVNESGVADSELLVTNQKEAAPDTDELQLKILETTDPTEDILEKTGDIPESLEGTGIAGEATVNEGTTEVREVLNEDTGLVDESRDTTSELSEPLLENVQLHSLPDIIPALSTTEERTCPESCICVTEGDSDEYKVDCSGRELTELPKPLNPKTTELNLENNKLTAISNEISALKNLKVLNANNNDIMEIVSGSLSELPELNSLKLGNNSLISFPEELMKFGLSKLQELDLGGNEMDVTSENFTTLTSLRKLILPTSKSNLAQDICANLKDSLKTVCTGSCDVKSIDCSETSQDLQNALLGFTLPGVIALSNETETAIEEAEISVPTVAKPESTGNAIQSSKISHQSAIGNAQETVSTGKGEDESSLGDALLDFAIPGFIALSSGPEESASTNQEIMLSAPAETPIVSDNSTQSNEFSLRSAVNKAPGVESKTEKSEDMKSESNNADAVVTVGAATEATKGGVDKSVIGIIVAGMVVVVAGITIKKNWGSIRKRFNSSPRTANDTVNTNGTSPEEVPLQQKLPV